MSRTGTWKTVRKVLKWIGLLVLVAVAGLSIYVAVQASAFNRSMAKVYDVPLPAIARSTDPAVLERGKHLTESLGACSNRDCHGNDLGGGNRIDLGPLGTMVAPNITPGGLGAQYSDGELARLLLHGLRRDGRTLRFMPAQDFAWWPDDDVRAVVSYLRTVPAVDKPSGQSEFRLLAKVLDRRDSLIVDVARRIPHEGARAAAPPPEPTATYGAFIVRLCHGCHGAHLSGGPIPGAPPSVPIPANITPHASGIGAYSYEDFDKLFKTGVKRDGKKLDPFMPYEALSKMNEVEMKALWAYLRTVPPTPYGQR